MRIDKAIKIFPRAITPKRVIHFLWDFEPRDGLGINPVCKMDNFEVIHGSFNLPPDAMRFPKVVAAMGGPKRWEMCKNCLKKIKSLPNNY